MTPARPWVGTYRLQLTSTFTFADAERVMPYLAALGVSHAYLSPILEARHGSTHGYDGVDPTRVRAELGGEGGFRRLAVAARRAGIGILLDLVPNHLAAHDENPWWRHVLRRGPTSAYARFFDIDWEAGGGRVVLPVLGRPLEEVIAAGEIALARHPVDGSPCVTYGDQRFPLAESGPRPDAPLQTLLGAQHYRLVHWRETAGLNYRRFFEITGLVGVRVEDEAVFDAVHARVLGMVREGLVDGLRIDHIDGLRDPAGYLRRLDEHLRSASPDRRIVVLVEKILACGESLPDDWIADGTTGYDFLGACAHLLADRDGTRRLRERLGAPPGRSAETALEAKRLIARQVLAPELAALTRLFWNAVRGAGVEQPQAAAADEVIAEISAQLPVYRTYADERGVSETDGRLIEGAVERARVECGDPLAGQVGAVLVGQPPFDRGAAAAAALEFRLRWQQFTGPLAAKGVEDTALYRDTAFVALNDVGCEPELLDDPAAATREVLARRSDREPHALNTTSTHDTKRGEDTRARIAAIAPRADEWLSSLERWREAHAALKTPVRGRFAPSDSDELLLYQTLLALSGVGRLPLAGTLDRVTEYASKAAREAKQRTTWTDPDSEYEATLTYFVRALIEAPECEAFREDLRRFAARIAGDALAGSLAGVLLKSLAPGVPDIYQGSELWDLSLVDPDNRRAVDFDRRLSLLRWISVLWASSPDRCVRALEGVVDSGAPKMLVLWRALICRRWLLGEGAVPRLETLERGDGAVQWSVSAGQRRVRVIVARPGGGNGAAKKARCAAADESTEIDQLSGKALPSDPSRALNLVRSRAVLPCAVIAVGERSLLAAPLTPPVAESV